MATKQNPYASIYTVPNKGIIIHPAKRIHASPPLLLGAELRQNVGRNTDVLAYALR